MKEISELKGILGQRCYVNFNPMDSFKKQKSGELGVVAQIVEENE